MIKYFLLTAIFFSCIAHSPVTPILLKCRSTYSFEDTVKYSGEGAYISVVNSAVMIEFPDSSMTLSAYNKPVKRYEYMMFGNLVDYNTGRYFSFTADLRKRYVKIEAMRVRKSGKPIATHNYLWFDICKEDECM